MRELAHMEHGPSNIPHTVPEPGAPPRPDRAKISRQSHNPSATRPLAYLGQLTVTLTIMWGFTSAIEFKWLYWTCSVQGEAR